MGMAHNQDNPLVAEIACEDVLLGVQRSMDLSLLGSDAKAVGRSHVGSSDSGKVIDGSD